MKKQYPNNYHRIEPTVTISLYEYNRMKEDIWHLKEKVFRLRKQLKQAKADE